MVNVRGRLFLLVFLITTAVIGLLFGRYLFQLQKEGRPQWAEHRLRILTYSTFVGATGPGPEIIAKFKKENKCEVDVITAGDAGLLLERLRLGSSSVPFDLVIGLDQLMLEEAAKSEWEKLEVDRSGFDSALAEFQDSSFVPFDWSPLGFVSRVSAGKLTKMDDLIQPSLRSWIAIQDPRSSSPGMQFYQWVRAVKGAGAAEFLGQLKPNVQSVSPSWSFSYGLFKKEQVRYVFSYLTSLAYHWGFENDRGFQIAEFSEGHPMQVEFVAVPKNCRECELARKFAATMIQPETQKIIMEKNFMFPILPSVRAGTIYDSLPKLKTIPTPRDKDFSDWDKVFKR